jgi:hypothetical protein
LLILSGCQKDSCTTRGCENGGVCINGTCDCPEGYAGNDCSVVLTPTEIIVHKIIVNSYPMTNNGSGWDGPGAGGPDPYFVFYPQNYSSSTFISATINNVTGGPLEYRVGFPYTIYSPNDPWVFTLVDEDFSSNDVMVTGVFTPNDGSSGFPEILQVRSNAINLSLDLYVTWKF